ncbi:MAG TPA: hypothetical protein PKD59_00015 [Miltoncostaeaceae bacterium]|nr:hypothetical protein [Miltoncostaeaceae bacterium]
MTRLVCPLCGTVAVDGAEPAAGECPGCGARYAGGAATPLEAVQAALAHWGLGGRDAAALARRMFEVEPPPGPSPAAAITSDQRDGFYLWWVFARGATPEAAFDALVAGGGA